MARITRTTSVEAELEYRAAEAGRQAAYRAAGRDYNRPPTAAAARAGPAAMVVPMTEREALIARLEAEREAFFAGLPAYRAARAEMEAAIAAARGPAPVHMTKAEREALFGGLPAKKSRGFSPSFVFSTLCALVLVLGMGLALYAEGTLELAADSLMEFVMDLFKSPTDGEF